MPRWFSRVCWSGLVFACLMLLVTGGLPTVSILKADDATATSIEASPATQARSIVEQAKTSGGFVVHLGCGDGSLLAELAKLPRMKVQGLDRDAADVAEARKRLQGENLYGIAAVDRLSGNKLPFVDNLINLLVVSETSAISPAEMLRVVAPRGVILTQTAKGTWDAQTKPVPSEIDDWTHYLHDPSGNAVAHDDQVGPPRHLQWVGSPRWSRHHDRMASMSALVSQGGKLYYIMDEGSRVSIQLPSKWKLICRDAFNGVELWRRDIADWQSHLWPLKSGPTSLARRLVAVDGKVYVTLGYQAPITVLDGATGETIRVLEGSGNAEEVIVDGGIVFVNSNKEDLELKNYAPVNPVVGDQANVAREFHWNEKPRVLSAYNAETGEQLWAKQSLVAPLTMTIDPQHLYFHDGEVVTALHRQSGEVAWSTEKASRRNAITFNFGPKLVVTKDVLLYAGGDGKMAAYAVADGKTLWSAEHPPSGYQSPQDLLVTGGLVWSAPTTSGRDSGIFKGRDLLTGEVKKEFPPDVDTYWFHHRCYIAKATDKFLMPSRTGVEFVDLDQEHWDIHHWVRGGCLYGVMPCNGLTYAPPHDCACYPEAKLYGFNALAARSTTRPWPTDVPIEGRLEPGPAYGEPIVATAVSDEDQEREWPTYRGNNGRGGYSSKPIQPLLEATWQQQLSGRLTPPVIAGGTLYVAEVDSHTVHALDASKGDSRWAFIAGGRVDSPPTVVNGRVLFGSMDGYVYCLRATDGALIWRFRCAPEDLRLFAYEQLESVWPVHGSLLVKGNTIYAVAGRSMFLDGGLRMVQIDAATGSLIAETLMDDRNPETGNNLQELTQTLQGPVGLPDILSCDDERIYMKSQVFNLAGERQKIGPNSGGFAEHASVQRGPEAHLFAPMGYLDDTWFHRSYWVFGRSFAGGHGGYYQAGKYAPSGRILVNGGGYVYGYGRKPEHLKWTTVLEHQLFAASSDPPSLDVTSGAADVTTPQGRRGRKQGGSSTIQYEGSKLLDPTEKPITMAAWVKADKPDGTIIAHGGPAEGYALTIEKGKPTVWIRSAGTANSVTAKEKIDGNWHHLAATLDDDKSLVLYVDGQEVASGTVSGLVASMPKQNLQIGADEGGSVGLYPIGFGLTGAIDEVRIHHTALKQDEIAQLFAHPADNVERAGSKLVLSLSMDTPKAVDASASKLQPAAINATRVEGKFKGALAFTGELDAASAPTGKGKPKEDSLVQHKWAKDIPLFVRALLLADRTLVMAGPRDVMNEHETFQRLSGRDQTVTNELQNQDDQLEGKEGAVLLVVDADGGDVLKEIELDSVPVWDSLATAYGRVYFTTTDGKVHCLTGKPAP